MAPTLMKSQLESPQYLMQRCSDRYLCMAALRLDLKTRGAVLTAAGIHGCAFEVGIALRCQGQRHHLATLSKEGKTVGRASRPAYPIPLNRLNVRTARTNRVIPT